MAQNITEIKDMMVAAGFSPLKQDTVSNRALISPYKLGQEIFCLEYKKIEICCLEYKKIDLNTVPGYQYAGVITDGLMTDDGRIVLCDHYKKSLLICNSDGLSVHTLPLEKYPWSVTAINDSTVAVTLPLSHTVQMYDINRRTKLRSIKLPGRCWGITTINNMLAVGGKGKMWIIDQYTGQVINTIKTNHMYTRLHTSGERLFSYEGFLWGYKTMTCYNQSGEKLFTTPPLPSGIKGVTTLQDGSLYVVSDDGKVYHLSSDGQNYAPVDTIQPDGFFIMYNTGQQKLTTGNGPYSLRIYHTS